MKFSLFNSIDIKISRKKKVVDPWRVPAPYDERDSANRRGVFFVHVHLPKTGGTSLNKILEQNLGFGLEPYTGRFVHHMPHITHKQILSFIEEHPGVNCLSSHMVRTRLPYGQAEKRIVALCAIRNPVDRFFSMYFHLRHFEGFKCIHKELDLDDYIDYRIEKSKGGKFNGYLQYLTGEESERSFDYVTQLIKGRHLYLIPTHRFQDGLNILQRDFPEYLKDMTELKENISKKDQQVTEEMRQKVSLYVSPYDQRLIDEAERLLL